jgi:RNA polymerase sigma-70 factor (ECF subfamily)
MSEDLSSAWKEWFRVNGTRLLLYARTQSHSEADAQDILQETMLRLWKSYAPDNAEKWQPPPLPLAYTALRHAAIDLARKNTRRTRREQNSDYLVSEHDPAGDWFGTEKLEQKEKSAALQKAIGQLPDNFRDVLVLKVWGELTFAEIAQALEIPANTAASRYRYALETLRKILKPNSL